MIAFLISTIVFVQTLKASGNCMFNPSGCRNCIINMQNSFRIVNLEIEATNRVYSQYCILKEYKAKIWLCKGSETNTNKILNLLQQQFFSQTNFLEIRNYLFNNIQVYNCKVLIGRDIVVSVLEGIFSNENDNEAIAYLNDYKHNTQTNKIESWFRAVTVLEFNSSYSIGHQRKLRKCRLGPLLHNVEKRNVGNIDDNANLSFVYLMNNSDILCCTTKARETLQQYGPKKEQPYRIIFNNKIEKIIAENGHLVLNCSEIALVSKVQWFKNNELLNSSLRHNIAEAENEPHITIDAYNSLYILQATKEEEGIYMCFINGRQVQTYFVKVVSKSKLLNQEFLKYSIYLGFVLSLTITCYCAGICVAWHQRNSFADPLYLNLNKR